MKPTKLFGLVVLGAVASSMAAQLTVTNPPLPPTLTVTTPPKKTATLKTTARTATVQMMADNTVSKPLVVTNNPETLLFDTIGSAAIGYLPSWRDVRPSPAPIGTAYGILLATNCPFEVTQLSALVVFDNPANLGNTEFEAGFFRNTNDLATGLYQDPEFVASDVDATLSKTLTDLGNGTWLLSLQLPEYGCGTNRVLVIRTEPLGNGPMAQMSFVASGDTVPGITAYAADNTGTNLVQVALPKMQVWRRMLSATRAPSVDASAPTQWNLTYVPGYQLGTSSDLNAGMNYQTDTQRVWFSTVDTTIGSRFFVTRPDPNQ